MKPGMLCTGALLDRGEASQGSKGRELVIGPMLLWTGPGRLKDSIGESWSFMVLASIFSCRRHLALRFWNQTCRTRFIMRCALPVWRCWIRKVLWRILKVIQVYEGHPSHLKVEGVKKKKKKEKEEEEEERRKRRRKSYMFLKKNLDERWNDFKIRTNSCYPNLTIPQLVKTGKIFSKAASECKLYLKKNLWTLQPSFTFIIWQTKPVVETSIYTFYPWHSNCSESDTQSLITSSWNFLSLTLIRECAVRGWV